MRITVFHKDTYGLAMHSMTNVAQAGRRMPRGHAADEAEDLLVSESF